MMNALKDLACRSALALSLSTLMIGSSIASPPPPAPLSQSLIGRIQTLMDNPKTWQQIPKAITLCVYSPDGARGKNFQQAASYMSEIPKYTQMARDIGIELKVDIINPLNYKIEIGYPKHKRKASTEVTLRVYTDERVLSEDFKAKKCDGAGMSNMRARQFNKFIGSLDAIGAILSYKQLSEAITALANPQFDKLMVNQDYEIVGIIPLGAAYIMVGDRKINTLAKAAGKKVAVFDFDKSQAKLVQSVGAQPVSVDFTSVGGKFNNGEVDIMAAPALLFQPFELYKGMTGKNGEVKGAIIRFPIMQVTGTLLMHRNRFPDGLGQIIREAASMQLAPAYQFVYETENAIPVKYWMDVPESDRAGYIKMMREARISMTKEGIYDKHMMQLLKRVRCKFEPQHYECSLKDE
ncbi:MAG: putative solute-binding protein [Pseudomonadota bacterium]|nr:putative solute-binding protein [Pseudomonadota bacterium]